MSHDEKSSAPRRFLIDVEETIRLVLEQEDTDGDFQISITDAGPKLLSLGTATSNGYKSFDIRVSVSCSTPQFLGQWSRLSSWPAFVVAGLCPRTGGTRIVLFTYPMDKRVARFPEASRPFRAHLAMPLP